MKEKGGRINWLIRHMMLITGLVLAVLLLIRGAAGTGRAFDRERLTAGEQGTAYSPVKRPGRCRAGMDLAYELSGSRTQ